jgi:drug/metabolite transporter, DME family
VLFLFAPTGTLQPSIRLFTYAGIHYMGASRGTTVRGSHPLFSTALAIIFLGEEATLPVIAGTVLIVGGITLISWQTEAQRASFRWWHIAYPLGAAFLAGISHPLRRYALGLANEPLYLAAVIGVVALPWLGSYIVLPRKGAEQPIWSRQSIGPFVVAGIFETLGIVLVIAALSVGTVVVVAPIVATSPLWILLGTWLFLRGIELLTFRTIFGVLAVVAGTIAISLVP